MRINRGDIFWIAPHQGVGTSTADEAHPDYAHPYVVIQEDVLNYSRLDTVVVCALTTNNRRASWPGNILLNEGEGGLPRLSIIEVSKVASVKKDALGEYVGSLSQERVDQILAGLRLLDGSHYR